MAGKGRPTVDDKRDNQYRVRLNDEENQMLTYCSQMTGQPKSQIFRKALEEYYQTVQLNEMEMGMDGISMRRVIKCPHCGSANAIDLSDYSTGDYESERQMGPKFGIVSSAMITNVQLAVIHSVSKVISMNTLSEHTILKKSM